MTVVGLEDLDRPTNARKTDLGWGSDPIAVLLSKLGYEYVALVPGASYRGLHDSIVNVLGNENPQMLTCLHEEHSVAIAHGYAKVTQRPMLAFVHSNVGLMHATMAIYNAWCDRVPMVIIGATGPGDAHQRRPWIDWIHTSRDQGALVRNYVKWDDQPGSVPATFESLLRAHQITMTAPAGPTYICLDVAMQEERLSEPLQAPDPLKFRAAQAPVPAPEQIDMAADWLVAAKRPVVLSGRASRFQHDWDDRQAVCEAIGGVVITDQRTGASFPTEHGLHVIEPQSRLSAAAIALLAEADVILALDWLDLAGTLKTCARKARLTAKIIHVSVDSYLHNGWSMDHQGLAAVDLPVLTTPEAMLRPLLSALDARVSGRRLTRPKYDVDVVAAKREAVTSGPISLRQMARCIAQATKDQAVTFTRFPLKWPADVCQFKGPLDFLGGDGGGGLGSGTGIAIGAALALKGTGRIPIAIIGDGDFLMGVNALWTAARCRIPVLIIVANNRAYQNDVTHQDQVAVVRDRPRENKWIGQRLDDPAVDLVAMARAQGFMASEPVLALEEASDVLQRGLQAVREGHCYMIEFLLDAVTIGEQASLSDKKNREGHAHG
ncbi:MULTISPECIES: thiamine pyrophosphate-binding protein [unclassified Beijerinckia]|uniref:thiamine pyrophosphate-binding protein n=1 Tax=unclassified Beijerinckia TaxID=2638183 RepID=UPI00089614DD|nr:MULTISPECIES: thiamine pyrophosphate-binding protein [unclassified Beijerinckia]MDH7798158.1 thiamine pyrophosphate-dependent acetolactate synthase large subunit-like protein [Beijerinckia sp. GAS462]SED11098.1 benzoylformate decarboxylase [Beijerinckia sp. 28-YEA-48]